MTLIGVATAWNSTMSDQALIVLLSGEIASGKASVSDVLDSELGFQRIRTGAHLIETEEFWGQ